MESLEGKVVGVSWQDIWWSMDDRFIDHPFQDEDHIHFTYGLVLRDTDEWLSITHEWRPQKLVHCGTTSIPKSMIRNVRVYGDGELEAASEEGPSGPGTAPAGGGDPAQPTDGPAAGARRPRRSRGSAAVSSAD